MRTHTATARWKIHDVSHLPFPPSGTPLEIEIRRDDSAVLRFSTDKESVELEGKRDGDRGLVGDYYQDYGKFRVWEEEDRAGRRVLRCVVDPKRGRPTSGSWVADEDDG